MAEENMAEKQRFPYMAEYLNWPNRNWPNLNQPNLNQPNLNQPNLNRSDHHPLRPPAPINRPTPSAPTTRSTLFKSGLLFLYLLNHFIYISAKFGHSRNSAIQTCRHLSYSANWSSAIYFSANWNLAITIITEKILSEIFRINVLGMPLG